MSKELHRLSVDLPEPLWKCLISAMLSTKSKSVSHFVRKTLIEKCLAIFNGHNLADETLELLDYLEELRKELK